jgi:hypothetical protein
LLLIAESAAAAEADLTKLRREMDTEGGERGLESLRAGSRCCWEPGLKMSAGASVRQTRSRAALIAESAAGAEDDVMKCVVCQSGTTYLIRTFPYLSVRVPYPSRGNQ